MGNCSENILFRFLDEIIGLPVTGNYSHRMHHTVVCIIIKSHIFQPAASLNPLTDVVIDVDHGYNTKFNMLKSVFSGVAGHIVLLDVLLGVVHCCVVLTVDLNVVDNWSMSHTNKSNNPSSIFRLFSPASPRQ